MMTLMIDGNDGWMIEEAEKEEKEAEKAAGSHAHMHTLFEIRLSLFSALFIQFCGD